MERSVVVQDQAAEISALLVRVNPEARKFVMEQVRHTVQWLEQQEKLNQKSV